MAGRSKILSFTGGDDRSSISGGLQRLRDTSTHALERVLTDFFDKADDALFGMSEKASSNSEQNLYFDAMRELRLQRQSMSDDVVSEVRKAFNQIGRYDPFSHDVASLADASQDSLSLVDNGELEQRVAVDNLVKKLRGRYDESIRLLTARVNHLRPDLQLADRQMPLSPEVLCSALGEAVSGLDIDIRAKLLVLKLYDQLIVGALEKLYQRANQILVEEGVLASMKHPPVAGRGKRTSGPVSVAPGRGQTESRGGAHQQPGAQSGHHGQGPQHEQVSNPAFSTSFTELSGLLHQSGYPLDFGSGQGPVLDTPRLLDRLGVLQASTDQQAWDRVLEPLSHSLPGAFVDNRGQMQPASKVDNDVINLVSMLFDFILEDRQLPSRIKALISRLQIPVLKVALLDRAFFNRAGHPARKLLNELAAAGTGWSEKAADQKDPLLDKIQAVVNHLVEDFADDVSIFEAALDDFQHFMSMEERRRQLVEQRLRDAEEGRARSEEATQKAQQLLADMSADTHLPRKIRVFFREAWERYLQWILLRVGESSEDWSKAGKVTASLIWCFDADARKVEDREAIDRQVPELIGFVTQELKRIAWDSFAIEKAENDLRQTYEDLRVDLERLAAPAAPAVDDQPADSASAETQGPGNAPAASGVQAPGPVERPRLVDMEGADEPLIEPKPETNRPDAEPEWLERARQINVGAWFEIRRNETKIRCKLAAYIKSSQRYIFANRNGMKIGDHDLNGLALALQNGDMAMVEDGLIFDRALETIIGNMKQRRVH